MCLSKTGLKAFLLIINVFLFLCGGVILGIGIWAVADKIYISGIIGTTLFASASYMMVVCGVFLVLLSFLGCLGGVTNKKIIVLVYTVCLVILFILLMTTAIVAAVFQEDLESGMREKMKLNIRERYGYNVQYDEENQYVTESWDLAQSRLSCCAVDDSGWNLYQQSRWFMAQYNEFDKKFVPTSCCIYVGNLREFLNVQNCQSFQYGPPRYWTYGAAFNPALHYQGCYNAVRDFVFSQSTTILAIGFSFCVFLITAIVISVMFLRKLSKDSSANLGR